MYGPYFTDGKSEAQRNSGIQRGSKSTNSEQRARIQTQVYEIQTEVGHIYFYRELAKRMTGIAPFTYLGIWKDCDPTRKSTVFGEYTTTHMEIKSWKGDSGPDFAFLLATCSPIRPTDDSETDSQRSAGKGIS